MSQKRNSNTVHPDTYVIVPAYNEAAVVGSVVSQLRARFDNVVVVDDGSSDDTVGVLVPTGATVLRHALNTGQGGALQTGLQFALLDRDARWFITFDADGQHEVSDAERVLEDARVSGADAVFGSRFLNGSGSGPDRLRRTVLRIATRLTNAAYGVRLTDTHNGLRVLGRRFVETLDLRFYDMSHASELIAHAGRGGFEVREVPVDVKYTEYSRSKGQSILNGVNIALDMLLELISGRGR